MKSYPGRRFDLILFNLVSGLSFSLAGAVLPQLSTIYSLSSSQASLVPYFYFIGNVAGLILLGIFIGKARLVMILSTVFLTVSSLYLSLVPGFILLFKLSFLVLGISSTVLVALPGMILSRSDPGNAAKNLSFLFAFFCIGVIVSPVMTSALLRHGFGYAGSFLILAVTAGVTVSTAVASRRPLPDLGDGLSPRIVVGSFRDFGFLLAAVIVIAFFYGSAESVPNVWIPQFFADLEGTSTKMDGRLILSLFWVAMTAGRYLCSWLVARYIKPTTLLLFLAVLGGVTIYVTPRFSSPGVNALGFVLSGLFLSGMYPLIIACVDYLPPKYTSMFMIVWAGSMAGASLMSRIVGQVIESGSFVNALSIGAVPLAGIVVILLVSRRTGGFQPYTEKS